MYEAILSAGNLGKRVLLTSIGFLVFAMLLSLQSEPAVAADPPTQPFELVFEALGEKLDVVQNGAGVFGTTEASVDMTVPGVTVRKAYLVWAGLGRDDNILIDRDASGQPVSVTADMTWSRDSFGFNTWGCCGGELTAYAADITDSGIVQIGTHSYTVSDMAVTAGSEVENWGYSLVVVYEDPAIETVNDVVIKLGNDGLHFRWDGNLGPNSDVQCVAFPRAAENRTMNFTVIVGGIQDIYRPNGLWGLSGNEDYVNLESEGGTWKEDRGLIDGVSGITGIGGAFEIDGPLDGDFTDNGVDWPFTDNRGDQWDLYPVFKVALDPADTWACVQIESANRPEIPKGEGTDGLGASIGFLGLIAVFESHEQPTIDIEKATNGEDADDPNGPLVTTGTTVTWTYAVTNTGDVTLTQVAVSDDKIGDITCPKQTLAPKEPMNCVATGVALPGQYANTATVVGTTLTGVRVTDKDPSHYFGATPKIDIEKATNGEDADEPTGPEVAVDDTVNWTYDVTNSGDVTLTQVAVTDDKIGAITCPKQTLAPGESMACAATGVAVAGQYANMATVEGTAPNGQIVTDQDPSHYFGVSPTGFTVDEPTAAPLAPRLYLPSILRLR